MSATSYQNFTRLGGDPFPFYLPGTVAGMEVTIVGGAVEFGDLLLPATDDALEQYDAGLIAGAESGMQVLKKITAGDAADFARVGFFSVCQEVGGIVDTGKGQAFPGPGTISAKVAVPAEGLANNTGLMPDFANGVLIPEDGSAKAVAVVAGKVNAGTAATKLINVRFNGTYGFGG